MSIQAQIEARLREALDPVHLEVINESHMHGGASASESHFRVTVVSRQFEEQPLIARHRFVNRTLAPWLDGAIHALALHVLSPAEWERRGSVRLSPPCMGAPKV